MTITASAAATRAARRRETHDAAPPLLRGSMPRRPWTGLRRGLALAWRGGGAVMADPAPPEWAPAAARRRAALLALVATSALLGGTLLLTSQPLVSGEPLRLAQVALFMLLFAWVSAGFVTALMGFRVLLRGDPRMLSYAEVARDVISPGARTAVVMPICNEHVPTVFAGLRATAESLIAAGGARLCEVYVLSDTVDAALRADEHAAWEQLRGRCAAAGLAVHYRWRQRRTHKKAGNVADFCRRWGRRHRYMIVLDADSVMSGEALLGLVRLMEAQPQAGIIQSQPVASGVDTLHARAQQFAGRVTGRLFSAGMQYWQLGESHYWGHNAIIRIAPFMAHAGLAALPGRGGLAGPILSHDFVEAALMRRAGWQVWLVPDLPGSYEQQPPHLLAELQRDRRWCQGNLQNARLLAEPGLHRVHRAMLFTGALSYLSSPLWLGFVGLGFVLWLTGQHALLDARQMLPGPVLALWVLTLALLLLPRVLGLWLVLRQGQARLYGGVPRLIGSALFEAGLAALQAPLRMAAHTRFVVGALTGLELEWKSPPRQSLGVSWHEGARTLAPLALLAATALGAASLADPAVALWLAPIALPIVLALPLAVWTGDAATGRRWRAAGWLLTPEETAPPLVLRRAWAESAAARPPAAAHAGAPPLALPSVAEAGAR